MLNLTELVNRTDAAFPLVKQWAAGAVRPVEFLSFSPNREQALLQTQVTTRSPMGAIVYETGGILVDNGWLRVLGAGHDRFTRTLPGWNVGKSDGFYLVADDAIGGFFAINGGSLGSDVPKMYYFAPCSLNWEPMDMGYSEFLVWAFSGKLDQFYEWIRWPGWETDVAKLPSDSCYFFYPFLWSAEGKGGSGQRSVVSVAETWASQMDIRRQLGG
jgi:hypothetical protein